MVSVRYLQECDLKTLGVSKMGPRKILLQAIYNLRGMTSLPLVPGYPLPNVNPNSSALSLSLSLRTDQNATR
jgi:hypothetical protein